MRWGSVRRFVQCLHLRAFEGFFHSWIHPACLSKWTWMYPQSDRQSSSVPKSSPDWSTCGKAHVSLLHHDRTGIFARNEHTINVLQRALFHQCINPHLANRLPRLFPQNALCFADPYSVRNTKKNLHNPAWYPFHVFLQVNSSILALWSMDFQAAQSVWNRPSPAIPKAIRFQKAEKQHHRDTQLGKVLPNSVGD